MRRRTLLAALAATSTGCLATTPGTDPTPDGTADGRGDSTTESPPQTDTRTDDAESAPGSSTPPGTHSGRPAEQTRVDFDRAEESPVETVRVGDGTPSDRVNAHDVVVWNDGSERDITITVRGGSHLHVSRTLSVPADGFVTFRLTEQVAYRIAVGVGGETPYSFELPDGIVDCNSSRTTVRVPSSGRVQYGTISTAMGCIDGTVSTGTSREP